MGRLFGGFAGILISPVLLGCPGTEPPELDAYLAVVDSVSIKALNSALLNFPEGVNVCFSSTFWPGQVALSDRLQDEVRERGWTLYDPKTPPGPNTFLVFVSAPSLESEGEMIQAGYAVWQVYQDEVTGWGDYWDYRMECQGDSCTITEAFGRSHYDLASTPFEEYMARERGVCAGSIPSLLEGRGDSVPGAVGGTVP